VVFYVNVNERNVSTSGGWTSYLAKLNSMKWWLYPSGTSGTRVSSVFGSAYGAINVSPYTKRDSSGLNAIEWIAKFYVDQYYKPNSSSDGFFVDNVLAQPNVEGDWNLDGTLDKKTASASGVYWRQGYASYFKKVRALMPGKVQLGNIGALGVSSATYPEYA